MKCSVRVLVALRRHPSQCRCLDPWSHRRRVCRRAPPAFGPGSHHPSDARRLGGRGPTRDPRLGCLAALLAPNGVKETHEEQVFFAAAKGYPIFDETITTYSR